MGEQLADLVMDALDEKARSSHETDVQELAERLKQLTKTKEAGE